MTPCEELGYKVGDVFRVSGGKSTFAHGSIVSLERDDGSSIPLFRLLEGECDFRCARDGGKGAFTHIKNVERHIKRETQDMIVKANGEPYATYESAKQQLSAKGLGDTHEVAGGPGGYFLQKKEEEQVTIRHGDYVSTKGMTEEQYHAVAEAFMAAGADCGEYPDSCEMEDEPFFGWSRSKGGLFHGTGIHRGVIDNVQQLNGRHLTISQVLNATNAKRPDEAKAMEAPAEQQDEPCSSVLDTLRLAQQRVNEAARELSIAQGVRDEALEAVRAELGEGFEISVVEGVPPSVDMSDPANWREGDLLEALPGVNRTDIHAGGVYEFLKVDHSGDIRVKADDAGDSNWCPARDIKFHSRPTK